MRRTIPAIAAAGVVLLTPHAAAQPAAGPADVEPTPAVTIRVIDTEALVHHPAGASPARGRPLTEGGDVLLSIVLRPSVPAEAGQRVTHAIWNPDQGFTWSSSDPTLQPHFLTDSGWIAGAAQQHAAFWHPDQTPRHPMHADPLKNNELATHFAGTIIWLDEQAEHGIITGSRLAGPGLRFESIDNNAPNPNANRRSRELLHAAASGRVLMQITRRVNETRVQQDLAYTDSLAANKLNDEHTIPLPGARITLSNDPIAADNTFVVAAEFPRVAGKVRQESGLFRVDANGDTNLLAQGRWYAPVINDNKDIVAIALDRQHQPTLITNGKFIDLSTYIEARAIAPFALNNAGQLLARITTTGEPRLVLIDLSPLLAR